MLYIVELQKLSQLLVPMGSIAISAMTTTFKHNNDTINDNRCHNSNNTNDNTNDNNIIRLTILVIMMIIQ